MTTMPDMEAISYACSAIRSYRDELATILAKIAVEADHLAKFADKALNDIGGEK